MIKVGVVGEHLAAINIVSTLSKSSGLQVHYTHPDNHTLEVLAGTHSAKPHRTREQLIDHCDYIVFMNPHDYHILQTKIPNHITPIVCTQPECTDDVIQLISLDRSVVLFTPSFDIEATLGHSLLIKSKGISKQIAQDAETIMRLCGSIQWVDDPSSYYILASISVILPMVSIAVIETIRSFSKELGTHTHQNDLLIQNVLYSISHALYKKNITPAAYASQACEYLGATQQFIKTADTLKSCQFDKVLHESLSQLITTRPLPKKITQHIDDNDR